MLSINVGIHKKVKYNTNIKSNIYQNYYSKYTVHI